MAFISSHRNLTTKTELDIFATPPTQNSIESGTTLCVRPISSLTDASPIEFLIPGSGEEYIDLAHTTLHLVVKIKTDETITKDKVNDIAPVNNFLHSIFSQVDIYLNQKCITPPSNNYNYRAYIENLLNYGSDAKYSHLSSVIWEKDIAGNMDNSNVDDKADSCNTGHSKRHSFTKNEQIVELYGNLHCDIFNQDKFMVNGVDMTVKLIKAKNEFLLTGSYKGRLEIIDANLFVRKVKINPSILIAHTKALAVSTAKYPITRVEIKTVTISRDIQSKTIDNLYLGQLPKRCIVGFVESAAFNGSMAHNPYNFQHFNHNYLALYVDSVQIPSKPLTPDYEKKLFTRSYHTLFSGSGVHFGDIGNNISLSEYPDGYCLAAFDLTPDLSCHDSHWNIIKSGSLRVEIRFSKPLEKTITAVIFSEFDNIIEIDRNRNVIIDYSS